MIRRSILIFPDFHNMEFINNLREKYDPLAKAIRPHITLVFPFESNITTEELKEHILSSLNGIKPFEIILQSISSTSDLYLFLNVKKGTDELVEMHDRLYMSILEKYLCCGVTYIPHITVGKFHNQVDCKCALEGIEDFNELFIAKVIDIAVEIIDSNENSLIEFSVSLK